MAAMTRPNVLMIVVHDLGTYLGCYGNASVCSARLDGLAAEGVRFTRNFAAAPFCSPSRASIVTGRWPHCHGLMGLVNLGWDLPEAAVTDARRFAAAGYETFLFGLQHEVKDVARLGFEHAGPTGSRRCEAVAAAVVEHLRGRGAGDRPFYARVGFVEVHRLGSSWDEYLPDGPDPAEVDVPPYLADTPGARRDLAGLGGAVRRMDAAVGTILDALAESGLADDTLVVFTTDHGPPLPRAKATLYDAGLNTALLMRWPTALPGGRVLNEMISNIDLLPTLLDAAGVDAPADVQGRSFLPLLRGGAFEGDDAVFAEKNTSPADVKRCIRTERWKYIRNLDEGPALLLPLDVETGAVRRDMGDAHLAPRPPVELYDLAADPLEQNNLAGGPAAADIERDLSARLEEWMRRTGDPALAGPIRRPPAEAELFRRACDHHGIAPAVRGATAAEAKECGE